MSDIYEYKGNKYVVIGNVIIKQNGFDDLCGVRYAKEGEPLEYVRPSGEFYAKFKQVAND